MSDLYQVITLVPTYEVIRAETKEQAGLRAQRQVKARNDKHQAPHPIVLHSVKELPEPNQVEIVA